MFLNSTAHAVTCLPYTTGASIATTRNPLTAENGAAFEATKGQKPVLCQKLRKAAACQVLDCQALLRDGLHGHGDNRAFTPCWSTHSPSAAGVADAFTSWAATFAA